MNQDKFFIGGDWVDPAGSDQLAVISPHTEEVIAKVPEATTADVDRAVAAARLAFDSGPWPQMSPAERADVIAAISAGIQARYEEMARTISEEMGSPITWATMGQVFAATMVLDFYTGLAREYPFEDLRQGMPPLTAIAEGYKRAKGTIYDANMTTILAGVALFAFGTGPIKGFAVTLIVGILTSMYTAVSVSRGIATMIYGRRRKLQSIAI